MGAFLRICLGVALVFSTHTGAAHSQAAQLLQTHIHLELTVDYDSGTLGGVAVLTLKNVGDGPVASVPIQLGRLMQISQVEDSQGNSVPYLQEVVTYTDWPQFQVCQARLTPGSPIRPGDSCEFTIRYAGYLVGYTETGMQYVQDRVDRDFTIIRTDARAFPMVAEPSLASLRAQPSSDFSFSARITVPVGLRVATGIRESDIITRDSSATWVFEGIQPVPFLNIAVAGYDVLEREGVRIYYFPKDSAGALTVMRAIEGATQLYGQWFGALEGGVRIHVIEIPDGWGSQASLTGGIIQTADTFRDAGHLPPLYHELSHLWNVPDLDRPSCRWNEGLAMFLQQRAAAELDHAVDLDAYMAKKADARRQYLGSAPQLAEVPFAEYGQRNMTDESYRTGQLMFFVLYRVLGQELFDRVLREFRQAKGRTGATTAEFADYLNSATQGKATRVLEDWLFTTHWAARLAQGESLEAMISESER